MDGCLGMPWMFIASDLSYFAANQLKLSQRVPLNDETVFGRAMRACNAIS